MPAMKALLALAVLLCASGLVTTGCSSSKAKQASAAPAAGPKKLACPDLPSWRHLANKIDAPVYCPAWLPDPLIGAIGNRWNNINSVSADRSYLESFVWQETGPGIGGGELHVVLRGYPGRTKIPTCRTGGSGSRNVPCFASPVGRISANGIGSAVYTVNQDADQWHVLYAWHHRGSLYTVSEHVAPPFPSATQVKKNLDRVMRSLQRLSPQTTGA